MYPLQSCRINFDLFISLYFHVWKFYDYNTGLLQSWKKFSTNGDCRTSLKSRLGLVITHGVMNICACHVHFDYKFKILCIWIVIARHLLTCCADMFTVILGLCFFSERIWKYLWFFRFHKTKIHLLSRMKAVLANGKKNMSPSTSLVSTSMPLSIVWSQQQLQMKLQRRSWLNQLIARHRDMCQKQKMIR